MANACCWVPSLPHAAPPALVTSKTRQLAPPEQPPCSSESQASSHPTASPLFQLCLPAARGDVPLLPLLAGHGPRSPRWLPAPAVRALPPVPSAGLQAGVPRPAVRAGKPGGQQLPVPSGRGDQAGAGGLRVRLRYKPGFVFGGVCGLGNWLWSRKRN